MVIADKLKMSYEMSNAGEFDELISKEELDQIDKTKDLFNEASGGDIPPRLRREGRGCITEQIHHHQGVVRGGSLYG